MEIMDKEWMSLIAEGASELMVSINEENIRSFGTHALHLSQWNRKINLTAITQPADMALKHYVDSLAPLSYMPLEGRVIDIGSGAGFPGIPLKIVRPTLAMTLVDSSLKKVSFLKEAIRELSLKTISAHHCRVEDFSKGPFSEERFNVAIMRAFSSLDACVKKALPLLKPDGRIIAMKGRDVSAEIETVRTAVYKDTSGQKVGGSALDIQVFSYALPRTGDGRSMVICKR